jgi:hypothetical protein
MPDDRGSASKLALGTVVLTSPTDTDTDSSGAIHLEPFAGSECEVVFGGLLHVDGRLKGNVRSSDETLVRSENPTQQ